MPTQSTPGVYVEETPNGGSTKNGVATSVTAFLGRTLRGPVNDPIVINNFSDFQGIFGSLWNESTMSFAIKDFFLNEGNEAIIVRLFNPVSLDEPVPVKVYNVTKARIDINGLILESANEGSWGNSLRARIDYNVFPETINSFNLNIRDGITGTLEVIKNVSTMEGAVRRVDNILINESKLVRVFGQLPATTPPESPLLNSGDNPWDDDHSTPVTIMGTDGNSLKNTNYIGDEDDKTGIYALEDTDIFNLLCIPPFEPSVDVTDDVWQLAGQYCERRRAMLIMDAPSNWTSKYTAKQGIQDGVGTVSKNAAIFFPRLKAKNIKKDNEIEIFAPCGAVAGVMSRTDVWKAPAGIGAKLNGVLGLSVLLSDAEIEELNQLGINCLRSLPTEEIVIWGSRTLHGDDQLTPEWKYFQARRLTLFIEESLYRGLKWAIFEPNDEGLWAKIRLNVGSFMMRLFREGAFKGSSANDAFFVTCDSSTTTQDDIAAGVVNIFVGFAPLKPAEYVVIKIRQMAGQI